VIADEYSCARFLPNSATLQHSFFVGAGYVE
jgi:hypothetical protein